MFAEVPEFASDGLLVSLYQSIWKISENHNDFKIWQRLEEPVT